MGAFLCDRSDHTRPNPYGSTSCLDVDSSQDEDLRHTGKPRAERRRIGEFSVAQGRNYKARVRIFLCRGITGKPFTGTGWCHKRQVACPCRMIIGERATLRSKGESSDGVAERLVPSLDVNSRRSQRRLVVVLLGRPERPLEDPPHPHAEGAFGRWQTISN